MTKIKFFADGKGLCGFEISGHSSVSCDDEIGKIVCSAVSSAAYMTANTITDIVGDNAAAVVEDGFMSFSVNNPSDATYKILDGFKLHIKSLADEYTNNIRITEV
ncbi:MAG: ribosomal-processing cysteine protease Prp [Acutalibacteraceae bacterium]|jgi:uncharacterized protein YsxB (DUF464 family)